MQWGSSAAAQQQRQEGRRPAVLLIIVLIVVAIIAPIAAKAVQMAVSRQREYLADATSVQFTRNPNGLISALQKLAAAAAPFPGVSRATQHLFIVNPIQTFTASPRRSWPRIPTWPIASLACAIWALAVAAQAFDLQAHRGGRGLAPENTLAAFRRALALGVTTLETDLAITKDGVVVLSHEPRLNPDLARGPDGKWLGPSGPTIHAHARRARALRHRPPQSGDPLRQQFPEQKPSTASASRRWPTSSRWRERRRPCASTSRPRSTRQAGKTTVDPAFARAVVEAIRAAKVASRTTIQSFDWRTLIGCRRLAPEIDTACLTIESAELDTVRRQRRLALAAGSTCDHGGSVPRLAKAAGCATWSPFWRNLTRRARRGGPCAGPRGRSLDGQRPGRDGTG